MIFLTVGSELPFDRLVKTVDQWAATNQRKDIIAQIAEPGPNGYHPVNLQWQAFISADEYSRYCDEAELIIAHAGMGSIITAALKGKPIIVMPRQAVMREHRNDHQIATVSRFSSKPGILIANDEESLVNLLDKWNNNQLSQCTTTISEFAEERLLKAVRDFILSS